MCVSPRRHQSTGKHTLPGLPHRTRTPLRDIPPPGTNLRISVYPLIKFCKFVFRKNWDPPHLKWRNKIYLIVQVTGSARGKVFPLVNSGILVSSNSLPHGQPYPVVPYTEQWDIPKKRPNQPFQIASSSLHTIILRIYLQEPQTNQPTTTWAIHCHSQEWGSLAPCQAQ